MNRPYGHKKESEEIFTCSFCSKKTNEVEQMIISESTEGRICNYCVNICVKAVLKNGGNIRVGEKDA